MSTAIDWPRISIESQGQDQRSMESQTQHYTRRAGTKESDLALVTSGTVPTTRAYVASSPRFAFNLSGWLVNAVPNDNDLALAASGTVLSTKPCSPYWWYAPNFSSWLVDTVPEAIDAGQQSGAATVPYDVSLGTGAEWFGRFYAVDNVRVERALAFKEPAKIDEFVAHGTVMRVVAEHFLKGTRDLTPKERSFLTRFYSRVHKKSK